jgi:hypothetical protein
MAPEVNQDLIRMSTSRRGRQKRAAHCGGEKRERTRTVVVETLMTWREGFSTRIDVGTAAAVSNRQQGRHNQNARSTKFVLFLDVVKPFGLERRTWRSTNLYMPIAGVAKVD